ncbi:MAG TPA: virulence-associated E family protein, partial [Bacillota bacterium]
MADSVLAQYHDWRNVAEWPEVPGTQKQLKSSAVKQGNPLEKSGPVGAFCKTYNIYQAIDTFLPGIYVPVDNMPDRYTYTGGSTTGGAIIYEDGAFLYSHHATDPAGGRLVNSFDLVRLHLFGEQDDAAVPGTPTNKLPSYTAMCRLAVADQAVAALISQERYERATADFAVPTVGDTDWMRLLQKTEKTGLPTKTANNVLIILENDPALKGKIAFDEFANRGVVLGAMPWDPREGRRDWSDNDDKGLRIYLEHVYGLSCPSKVDDALGACAYRHKFNEVQDYLNGLVWDGVNRVDTLLIDYLGAEDTDYTKAVTRKSLVGAVARAMTPGVKFDYTPILIGPQGVGKSTLIRLLGRNWFSDSLTNFEGKEAAEMLQGVWINELGELSSLNRSETNIAKQFLSRTEDIYREPFGKRTARYPRRCVFWGTTNESEFLKDTTGGRRFWPIETMRQQPIKSVFRDLLNEVDQIWAEAMVRWQVGEPLFLSKELELKAR